MKKSKFSLLFFLACMVMMTTSCVTSRKVRYLQDMPIEGLPLNKALEATITPNDELRIFVLGNGKNEELLKPFNVMGMNGGQIGNNVSNTMGYLVDANGHIEFPVLGELEVAGLTRVQLQDTICARLQRNGYVNDPLVIVRFMNFKVFFLGGEGGKVLNITDERCTFLEALAMAGGLDFYTRRDRIGVMREVDGKRVIHYLDPRSTSVFDDEFFLLQQNDIIFTEANRRRYATEAFSNWSMFGMTIVSSISSIATLWLMWKYYNPDK